MFEPNAARILASLSPNDVVLDIGGWARPFNRANIVVDAEPYETRGFYGSSAPAQGGTVEHFTRETWIQRDICERTPYPFADKSIDFAICSHVLEDVRDPLWVCSELVRIARRGYIEVPSRIAESSRGTEPSQVGWSHHRWLVDISEGRLTFTMKYHKIHSHWRFSLPARYLHALPEPAKVQWLFWEGSFSFSERTIHGVENIASELERFVREVRPYPAWLVGADAAMRNAATLARRGVRKITKVARSAAGASSVPRG